MNERIALYSSSLYSVAVENNCAKEVYESIISVKAILADNVEYAKIVSSASIPFEEREKLLNEAFEGKIHTFALNFMKILAKRRVFEIFCPVADEFEKCYMKDNNIQHAKIITAIELSDEKKKDITAKISASTGKEIIPCFAVDESIVGGIVIETENSSIDASITGKLQSLRRYISKN